MVCSASSVSGPGEDELRKKFMSRGTHTGQIEIDEVEEHGLVKDLQEPRSSTRREGAASEQPAGSLQA